MKLFKSIHEYNYQWDLVSAANWQKYPNENCPHVQHVDVLNRTVDPETGILTTERLITVEQSAPRFILKLLGGDTTQYVREISTIDPNKKVLSMESINLTMSNFLSVHETIKYEQHPEDNKRTQFSQQAAITAGSALSRWGSMLEDFSLKRFTENASIGREGFAQVLERFVVLAEAKESTAPAPSSP